MVNPFLTPVGGSRRQFTLPQNQFMQPQNQYDFSGWGDRLGKIEEGIAGLTKQFNNFQTPGDVAPEYTGNAAPEPFPILPDINTIARPGPIMGEGSQTQVGGPGGINTLQPGGPMPEGSNEMFGQRPGRINPGNINPDYSTPINSLTANAPEPLGGIESLVAEPAPAPMAPTPTTPMGGQSLTRRGPLSLTEKLRNEYLMETKGPLTMGGEWDARAKEMGFDFRKQVRQLEGGEWAGTGQGADHFNKLFEEAGGVLDRPEMGAAARYGEGFTNWLSGKGYEVYTEPQQEWMTQSQGGLGAFGRDDLGQDTSGYIPHLSQYAMTAEEMQDPEGTLKERRNNLVWPTGSDTGTSSGLPPGLEGFRGGKLNPKMTNLSNLQQQGIPIGLGGGRERPGWTGQHEQLQAQSRALQAGVGALQGPTQQKIQQGLGALV